MDRKKISFEELNVNIHHLWKTQWLVLCSGDFKSGTYNAMTVAWGSLGTMWNKPFAQVVVRPTRYTFEFMEKFNTFTLSVFPKSRQQDVTLLGTRSGRDGDKIAEANFTPVASHLVSAPGFNEAALVLECEKIYWQDMAPDHFLDASIDKKYNNDYHRIYFGEVKGIWGEVAFQKSPGF